MQWPLSTLGARVETEWNKVFPAIRDHLITLIKNHECAYLDPQSIITDDSCLVMTTDASDFAVAVSLFRVKMGDTTQVTVEHLKDPKVI